MSAENLKFNDEAVEIDNKEQHHWFINALKGIKEAEEAMKRSAKNNVADLAVLERAKSIIEEMKEATVVEKLNSLAGSIE